MPFRAVGVNPSRATRGIDWGRWVNRLVNLPPSVKTVCMAWRSQRTRFALVRRFGHAFFAALLCAVDAEAFAEQSAEDSNEQTEHFNWREFVPEEVRVFIEGNATNPSVGQDLASVLPQDARPQTVIRPGELVFLALPFTQQGRGGICAGASLLNIVDFLGSNFQLSQIEFFTLFDAGRSGATISQMDQGLKNVGYEFTPLLLEEKPKRKEVRKIARRCMDILDSGQPLSASIPGHALTLVGYNMRTESFYAWDQAKTEMDPRVSEAVPNLPGGVYEIPMSQLGFELDALGHITKCDTPFDGQREKEQLLETLGAAPDAEAEKHRIWAPDRVRDSDVQSFYRDALPVLINGLMRKGRTAVIPTGKEIPGRPDWRRGELLRVSAKTADGYRGLLLPGGQESEFSLRELARFVHENDGIYFSLASFPSEGPSSNP